MNLNYSRSTVKMGELMTWTKKVMERVWAGIS